MNITSFLACLMACGNDIKCNRRSSKGSVMSLGLMVEFSEPLLLNSYYTLCCCVFIHLSCFTHLPNTACAKPLGMESGLIEDAQITASSQYDGNHAAIQARLNFLAGGGKAGGWSTRSNNLGQWLQIDLVRHTKVTQVVTQGRNAFNQWVTNYKLQYSEDGLHYYFYHEQGQNLPKV